ncbi:ribosome assembly protein 3 [Scheffersomyces spartinae]|uniref:Ribosome assembly protein 3 n=1 Tax=Scheffersomyces spartinae TaxID=45513 RepID=A0A9P8AIG7_9ASCO|nr:ribosome assembly protein 3 [Scheffersomyces spartinae]KAG7193110.1 ribosome assembly protein 3 [Scheffersomyces spartinae]
MQTEDFSSDSESSSSSSDSNSDSEVDEDHKLQSNIQKGNEIVEDIQIDADVDLEEQPPQIKGLAPEPLDAEQISQVQQIKLTTTKLSAVSANKVSSGELEQIEGTLKKDREQLNQAFLLLMAGQYANDMDALRKRPDFTDKSLVILAKTLQSGANMFDEETLRTVLN